MAPSFGGPSREVTRPKFWFTVTFKSGKSVKVHAHDKSEAISEAEKANPGEQADSVE